MSRFLAAAILAFAIGPAWARRAVFIQPPRPVPISRAMTAEQLCNVESRARTIREATAHALRCYLRNR